MPSTRSPRLRDAIPAVKSRGTLDTIRALFRVHPRVIAAISATATDLPVAVLSGPGALQRVLLTSDASLAAHASDHWTFTLEEGSTTLATWSTNSDVQAGSLTVNTPAEMTLAEAGKDREMLDKAVLLLTCTKGGSVANFSGRIDIEIDPILG